MVIAACVHVMREHGLFDAKQIVAGDVTVRARLVGGQGWVCWPPQPCVPACASVRFGLHDYSEQP